MDEAEKQKNSTDDIELVGEPEEAARDAAPKLAKLKEELKRCEAERKEYLEGWQRAKADHLNYRKDEARRFEDMARFVSAEMAREILTVLDSFDLALKSAGSARPPDDGLLLIRSQLADVLKKRGLEELPARPGDAFNPEVHEALGETEAELPPGSIAEVVQRGYRFQDRVLRPARVKLTK